MFYADLKNKDIFKVYFWCASIQVTAMKDIHTSQVKDLKVFMNKSMISFNKLIYDYKVATWTIT